MSTDLTTFTIPTGGELRAILDENGNPLIIAADIAKPLGYRNASDMTRRLDEDEKGTRSVRTPGGSQNMLVITEPGLYAAILGSKVEGAKAFKRWVTHEVLPALRRDGHVDLRPAEAPALPAGPDLDSLEKQARIVATLTRALPADFVETKARLLVARAMGETPEIDPARRPLSISDYLESYQLSDKEQRSISTRMGKAVKALYIAKHGTPPGTIPRLVNNHLKPVCAYVESDRPLMDAAFAQICPQPPMAIGGAA